VKPIAITRHPDARTYAAASSIVDATTAVTIKAAGGIRNFVTGLQIDIATSGSATGPAMREGGGRTVSRGQLQAAPMPLASITFQMPPAGSPSTLLEVVALVTVESGVFVNGEGYAGA